MNDISSKDEKCKFAKKLHRQFGHPTSVKHIGLLKNADINSKELYVIIEEITKQCEVCLKYQKKQIKPVVGFPLVTKFNKYVAMDLKLGSYQEKVCLIHIVDHLTQYNASCVIQSKNQKGKMLLYGVFLKYG